MNRQNLASPTSEILGIIVISILHWYGGRLVLVEKTLDGASFMAYIGLAYNILVPAKAISRGLYNIKQGNAAAERIQEIIDTPNPLKDKENALVKYKVVGFYTNTLRRRTGIPPMQQKIVIGMSPA